MNLTDYLRTKRVIGAAITSLVLAACGSASTTSTSSSASSTTGSPSSVTPLTIAINNTSASLPVYVAAQEGFFTKEGLKASYTMLADITKVLPSLGKQYDIGFSVQPLIIRAVNQGLPVQQISGNEESSISNPGVMLVTKKGSNITTPQSLVGKKIGAPTLTGNIHLGTLYWLKTNGVNPTSVTSVQVATPAMIDQIKAGLIAAAEMQQPYINYARSQGLEATLYPLAAVGNPTFLSAWAANKSWAAANGKTITEFKAALNDAYQWISKNPDQARTLLSNFTHLPLNVVANSPLPFFTTNNTVSSVQQWGKVLSGVAKFNSAASFTSMVYQPNP